MSSSWMRTWSPSRSLIGELSPWWLLVILLALAGLSLLSWSLRALDAVGATTAFVLGLIVGVAGGLGWLLLMTAFTAAGVLVTRLGRRRKAAAGIAQERGGERGIRNVMANGLAPTLAALCVLFVDERAAALAFATAVATVTADTMASEVGSLSGKARSILPPFDHMRPGDNGGVSWLGQVAAAGGATVIAVASIFALPIAPILAIVPAIGGFVGCQVDSLLGATLEQDALNDRPLTNEDVNFLASAIPALIVLVIAALA